MSEVIHDVQRWQPAPTLARETKAMLVGVVGVALAGVVAVAIGGPPVLAVMLCVPAAAVFVGRWVYRFAVGDATPPERRVP